MLAFSEVISTKFLQNTGKSKSSHSQMFFKILSIFTGKHLKACNFIKKRLQHRCFPVNIAKLLRTVFYRTPMAAGSEEELLKKSFQSGALLKMPPSSSSNKKF